MELFNWGMVMGGGGWSQAAVCRRKGDVSDGWVLRWVRWSVVVGSAQRQTLSTGGRELGAKEGARGCVCGVPAWEMEGGGKGEKEEDGIGLARADAV